MNTLLQSPIPVSSGSVNTSPPNRLYEAEFLMGLIVTLVVLFLGYLLLFFGLSTLAQPFSAKEDQQRPSLGRNIYV